MPVSDNIALSKSAYTSLGIPEDLFKGYDSKTDFYRWLIQKSPVRHPDKRPEIKLQDWTNDIQKIYLIYTLDKPSMNVGDLRYKLYLENN